MDFSGPTSAPEDPVLARLFPTAYPADEEAAAEFRRFTEGTLRDGKARGAASIIDQLEEAGLPDELDEDGLMIDVELDEPTAETWLRSFTDLRLALATRLGIEDGDEDVLGRDARRGPARAGARHLRVGRLPAGDPRRRPQRLSPAETRSAMPIPPYVAELRALVGARELWMPGVTAVVRRGDELLLTRRADNGRVGAGHRDHGPRRGARRHRAPGGAGGGRGGDLRRPARGGRREPADHLPERRPRDLPGPGLRLHLASGRGPRGRRREPRGALVAASRRCPPMASGCASGSTRRSPTETAPRFVR